MNERFVRPGEEVVLFNYYDLICLLDGCLLNYSLILNVHKHYGGLQNYVIGYVNLSTSSITYT